MSYPERIDPESAEPGILALHLKRYEFARALCAGADVLDAACGVGYGTAYLAETAQRVSGVDANAEAIARAQRRYSRPNVDFRVADVLSLPDAARSYDVVCSFETVEHVEDPGAMLRQMARVLRDGGVFIVSTPIARRTTRTPANPHHLIEWNADDFVALLDQFFTDVRVHGQRRSQTRAHRVAQRLDVLGLRRRFPRLRRLASVLGTAPIADLTLADVLIEPGVDGRSTELVAVCQGPRR